MLPEILILNMKISYSRNLILGIAAVNVVLIAGLFYRFAFQKTSVEEINLRCNTKILESSLIGQPLPKYKFEDRRGNEVYENLTQGKVLMVVFLTHCQACINEFEFLQNNYAETDSEFKIAAVTSESGRVVEQLMDEHKFNFPIYLDVEGSLMLKMRVSCTPTLLFLQNGIVQKIKIGNTENYQDIMEGF